MVNDGDGGKLHSIQCWCSTTIDDIWEKSTFLLSTMMGDLWTTRLNNLIDDNFPSFDAATKIATLRRRPTALGWSKMIVMRNSVYSIAFATGKKAGTGLGGEREKDMYRSSSFCEIGRMVG